MKKRLGTFLYAFMFLLLFSGCKSIGSKHYGLSSAYLVTTIIAVILLAICCVFLHNRNVWFLLLFSSVCVVNLGYYLLSVSTTLAEALRANRISYFGSVLLPLSMLLIIIKACQLNYKKWLPLLLLIISGIMFLIAASPGYLDIYYKQVDLIFVKDIAVLDKVYGPLHVLYLVFLIGYFTAMIAAMVQAIKLKKLTTTGQVVMLIGAVFVNMGIWFMEQLVHFDFEFLSVSYLISELFLLALHLMLHEQERIHAQITEKSNISDPQSTTKVPENEKYIDFAQRLNDLTQTERIIYNCYLEGKTTAEILEQLNIKENTLKYHNKNIFSKLGVSSRKQLKEIAKKINT